MPTIPNLEEQFDGLKAYITSPESLRNIALQAGLLEQNDSENKIQAIVYSLSKSISITLVNKNMVQIKITGNDPKTMIFISKSLSSLFIKEYLKPIISSAKSMSAILKRESEEQKNKLNESINQLNRFQSEHNNSTPESSDLYKDQLKEIYKSLEENKEKYRDTLTEISWLEQSFKNPALVTLNSEIKENETKLNQMRLIYNDDYIGIKEAEQLSFELKKERDKLLKGSSLVNVEKTSNLNDSTKLDSLPTEQRTQYLNLLQKIKGIKEQIANLNQQKNSLLTLLKKANEKQNELTTLSKTVDINQTTYNDLLNRYNLVQIMSQLDFENQFKVIKIMAVPLEPLPYIGRPFALFMTLSIVSCLVLGISLAIVLDLMDDTARKRKTLETLTGIAVISRIGKISI